LGASAGTYLDVFSCSDRGFVPALSQIPDFTKWSVLINN